MLRLSAKPHNIKLKLMLVYCEAYSGPSECLRFSTFLIFCCGCCSLSKGCASSGAAGWYKSVPMHKPALSPPDSVPGSPCPLCVPCSSGTSETPNPRPALKLLPEGDGSIINPKLESFNRAIHQLGKSADSILRLVESNEIVLENSLQKILLEHKNLDAHSKKSFNSSVHSVLCIYTGAHVG